MRGGSSRSGPRATCCTIAPSSRRTSEATRMSRLNIAERSLPARGLVGGLGPPGAADVLLEVANVTAGYAQDIDVLRDVSLTVHGGHVSGLIGLNGAGKSTLVKTICGLLPPKAGRIEFLGTSIAGIAPHRLIDRGICCIPQESSLFPYLSVEENLLLPLQGRARRFGAVMAARYREVQEIFPALAGRRRAPAGDLSGGQQKQ